MSNEPVNQQAGGPSSHSSPQMKGPAGGGPQGGGAKAKRHVRNYLLQPLLQVKLGLYCILLAVLFASALAAIAYVNFGNLVSSILLMTDAQDEVRDIILSYWKGARLWIFLTFIAYLALTITISVFYTHKLVGPTIAFRRHIRSLAEGRLNARTYLRKGDAFAEVADELNHLSEVMERKASGK